MSDHEQDDSQLLFKGSCESCGSSDANANYSDGHTHCFSCGAHTGPTEGSHAEAPRPTTSSDFAPSM